MTSPVQQGILVGAYYPSLKSYDYGLRHAELTYKDNYAKYFRDLGIRRYEMMVIMPYMLHSDILFGLENYDYFGEKPTVSDDNDNARTTHSDSSANARTTRTNVKSGATTSSSLATSSLQPFKNKKVDSSIIDSISLDVVVPKIDSMSELQKSRIDVEGLTRWFLRINHKQGAITEDLLQDINEIARMKNKLKIKHLKPIPDLCYYISQKSRISGSGQDIRSASVVIEPLHGDMFNMIIPHIPINQTLPLKTNVVIKVDVPFSGADSMRKYLWSSNLMMDKESSASIASIKANSIFKRPWIDCMHIGSIDLGSEVSGKFTVEEVDTSLQQSYQIFTFNRDVEDKYFELSMYFCYNMLPIDLIDKLLEIVPKNKYVNELKKVIQ